MDTRYIFSALIGAFCLVLIFAAITTARHLSQREVGGSHKAKQGRQAEYDRLTALPWGLTGRRAMSGEVNLSWLPDAATKLVY
jgi:hypothetical protein